MKIGFIGLGIMGSRMAANLLKSGYPLVVYNRTKSKADALLVSGANWAKSPAEAGKQADVVITMLADPKAVSEAALGPNGFLDQLKPGALWIDSSTVNPAFTRRMAEEAKRRQVHFLDAPVSGSKNAADSSQLLFMVGGSEQDLQTAQPLLEAMGRRVVHVGGVGMGTSLKIVVNSLLGQAMLAFAEAMTLGESMGISQRTLLDFLLNSAAVAPFVASKRPKIETGQFDADFPLSLMRKDLQLAAQTAYEQSVAMPGVNTAKEIFALAAQHGLADADFSAIYRFLSQADE